SHISSRRVNGKLEGSYMLPINVRATAGLDYERYTRELPGLDVTIGGITGIRGRTEELTLRGDLRRSISDFATGAVGAAHSVRTGSDWYALSNVPAQGIVYGNQYSYSQIYQ